MPSEFAVAAPWMKPAVTAACLAVLWSWESFRPLFARPARIRHAINNLAIAIFNTVILALTIGTFTVLLADWSSRRHLGLLHIPAIPSLARLLLSLLLLDAWMYAWHRMNHRLPFLWRFHRMHHSDYEMDVTTATRFHLGEHLGGGTLRLALIPLLGIESFHLMIYETLVVAITMLHHANISLGRWDRPLRCIVVTPDMHKVHHSRLQPETDSNYSTVLSVWDRLFRSFRMRENCLTIQFGLDGYDDPRWQSVSGMLKTPLRNESRVNPDADSPNASQAESHTSQQHPR